MNPSSNRHRLFFGGRGRRASVSCVKSTIGGRRTEERASVSCVMKDAELEKLQNCLRFYTPRTSSRTPCWCVKATVGGRRTADRRPLTVRPLSARLISVVPRRFSVAERPFSVVPRQRVPRQRTVACSPAHSAVRPQRTVASANGQMSGERSRVQMVK